MRKVLLISFSPIRRDPRVMRQVRLLESMSELTVAGFGEAPDARAEFVAIHKEPSSVLRKLFWGLKLLVGAHESFYWNQPHVAQALASLQSLHSDVLIANDLSALPLALRLARGKPVVFDAHEYAPGEHDNQMLWRWTLGRFNRAFCRRYLHQASSMLTVCQGIAQEYATHYGVRPLVLHNAPAFQKLSPAPLDKDHIRMIHHGVASSARHLEVMIEMMSHLDERFTLDFMLMESEPGYLAQLQGMARGDSRIRFVAPVAMPQICASINPYDLGVYLLPPDNFNHRHALPNKFFEFVQARLAVAIGPSPEMASLVRQYGCGIVSDSFDPQDLAQCLSALDRPTLDRMKWSADKAAHALCFENEGRVLADEVKRWAP